MTDKMDEFFKFFIMVNIIFGIIPKQNLSLIPNNAKNSTCRSWD